MLVNKTPRAKYYDESQNESPSKEIAFYCGFAMIRMVSSDGELDPAEYKMLKDSLISGLFEGDIAAGADKLIALQDLAMAKTSSVPKFFQILVNYDLNNGTNLSAQAIQAIYALIVYVAQIDGKVTEEEQQHAEDILRPLQTLLIENGINYHLDA